MAIVWILLWVLALIIIIKDYKTESTIWLSIISFFTGLGAFTVVFEENIMKYFISQYGVTQETINLAYLINAITVSYTHLTLPTKA